jgi:hypothetical protein
MGRFLAAALFWVVAAVFGVVFLLITATKLMSGQLFGYVGMAIYGVGCAACVIAARHFSVRRSQPRSARTPLQDA